MNNIGLIKCSQLQCQNKEFPLESCKNLEIYTGKTKALNCEMRNTVTYKQYKVNHCVRMHHYSNDNANPSNSVKDIRH